MMTTPPAFVRPARFSAAEWEARVQLAAAYRIFDHLGWTELIYNHISLRVPGAEPHFLINPFGLHYSEVRASNLVKVDVKGNIIGHSDWPINPAGFTFTSVAIMDALKMFPGPIIELHISNVHRREAVYHKSLMSAVATAVIMGLGPDGYRTAVEAMGRQLAARA